MLPLTWILENRFLTFSTSCIPVVVGFGFRRRPTSYVPVGDALDDYREVIGRAKQEARAEHRDVRERRSEGP